MFARSVVMVSAILVLATGFSAGGEQKGDKENLQGEWLVVSMELSGQKTTLFDGNNLVIKGDEWAGPASGKNTFKIDSTKNPKEIDLESDKGGKLNTWRGIYKIEGDTFTFCRSHAPDGARPKEFKGGEGVALMVYKRVKK
jgi:uncharacterized protein (TIGR03067 family)